ncbi:MAG: transposase [bacterium]
MARYKNYSYDQMVMLPIRFDQQIMPGTFEEAINQIVDKHIDLTIFESRYKNDETGRCAYDPAILLKIVLLAYSRGITGSRKIEQACNENVVFMAISADSHPDHSTIAAFISKMEKEIKGIFCDILIVCEEMGLIGGTMFAIDGCKLPSNASKEWSGTKADFEKKKTKLERTIKYLMEEHKTKDKEENKFDISEEEKDARIKKLQNKIEKITKWIKENKDKEGSKGNAIKSNITDNESAKMVSSHGVIQGYNGIAAADSKHQVIVSAEVYGDGNDQKVLKDVIEKTEEGLTAMGKDIKDTKIIADSGFYNKDNIHMLDEKGLDAYIPDKEFRKRDPRRKAQKANL